MSAWLLHALQHLLLVGTQLLLQPCHTRLQLVHYACHTA
jgi:hypothetical protein